MRRRWSLDGEGYPVCSVWDGVRSIKLYAHRFVARAPAQLQVDHRWHDKLDVRRSALRIATPAQNSANTRRFKAHLSRFRGVTRHVNGKWQAQCKHADINHYLGLFARETDAARAYDRKARQLFGQFAITNDVALRISPQDRAA